MRISNSRVLVLINTKRHQILSIRNIRLQSWFCDTCHAVYYVIDFCADAYFAPTGIANQMWYNRTEKWLDWAIDNEIRISSGVMVPWCPPTSGIIHEWWIKPRKLTRLTILGDTGQIVGESGLVVTDLPRFEGGMTAGVRQVLSRRLSEITSQLPIHMVI